MPKKVLIVRHAKSDWEGQNISDFDRPLNPRGHRAAPEMAKRIKSKALVPQILISSPALRAITTAGYFADEFKIDRDKIKEEPGIYESSASNLLKIINRQNDKYDYLAIFGHNPGLTELAIDLSDFDEYNMPTCATLLIEFPFESWAEISGGTGNVLMYDYPKNQASL